MRKQIIKRIAYTVLALLLIIILASSYLLYLQLSNNFHTVIPNKVYRSKLLSDNDLNHIMRIYNIESILNINSSANPYENKLAAESKIKLKYLPLQAHGTANKQQLLELIHTIETYPKPILIHCAQGADRTGLASALAIIVLQPNYNKFSWKHQISYKYGVVSPNSIGYHVLYPYMQYIDNTNLKDNKKNFLKWLNQYQKPTTSPYGWFWIE